jgi:hypothetical protein
MSTKPAKDAAYFIQLKEWQKQVLLQIVQDQQDKRRKAYDLLQTAHNREVGLEKMRKAVAAPEFVPGVGFVPSTSAPFQSQK